MLAGNALQFPQVGGRLASAERAATGLRPDRQHLLQRCCPGKWFSVGRQDMRSERLDAEDGREGRGGRPLDFPDPDRTAETYIGALGGPGTFDAFLAAVRSQRKGHWDPALTAAAVNDYVRAGFGMKRLAAPAQ